MKKIFYMILNLDSNKILMKTSLIGKALNFGFRDCGFEPYVFNIKIKNYSYLISSLNIIISKKSRFIKIKSNLKLLKLIMVLKKLGLINSFIILNYKINLIKISPFFYKNTTFFKLIKLISASSKKFSIRLKALKLINFSLGEAILLIETSKGILTHKEAIRLNTGGFLLCVLS